MSATCCLCLANALALNPINSAVDNFLSGDMRAVLCVVQCTLELGSYGEGARAGATAWRKKRTTEMQRCEVWGLAIQEPDLPEGL